MAAETSSKWLLLNPEVVRQALSRLLKTKVHPHFAGYLCLLNAARAAGKQDNLHLEYKGFFEQFLKVDRAPARSPFVQPFTDLKRGKGWSPFFNENVAGSYARSSLREDVAPYLRVATISGDGSKTRHSLKSNHANQAFGELLHKRKLGVASLALFLYRDYGFSSDSQGVAAVIAVFRDEFGFRDSEAKERAAFNQLFADDSSEFTDIGIDIFLESSAESGR